MAFNNFLSFESTSQKHPEVEKTSLSINYLKQKIAFVENELNKFKLPKTKKASIRKSHKSMEEEKTKTKLNSIETKTRMKKKRVKTKSGDKLSKKTDESLKSICTAISNPGSIPSVDDITVKLIEGRVLNEFQFKKRVAEDTFVTTIPYVTYAKRTSPGKVLQEVAETWLKMSEEFTQPLQTIIQKQKDSLKIKSIALERSIETPFYTLGKEKPKINSKTPTTKTLMKDTSTKKQFHETKIAGQEILLDKQLHKSPRNEPAVMAKPDKEAASIVDIAKPKEVILIRKKLQADNPMFYPGFCERGDKKPKLFTLLKEHENIKRKIVHVPENLNNADIIKTFSWRMRPDGKLKELKKKTKPNDDDGEIILKEETTSDKENKIREPLSWRKMPKFKRKEPSPSEPKNQKQRSYNPDEVREYIKKQHKERKQKFSVEKQTIENLRKKKVEALKGLMEIQRRKVANVTSRKESKSPKLVLSRKINIHRVKNDRLRHPSFVISLSKPITTKSHKTIQTEQLLSDNIDIDEVVPQTQVDPTKASSFDNTLPKTSVGQQPSSSCSACNETSSSDQAKGRESRSLLNGFQCEVPSQTMQPMKVDQMVNTEEFIPVPKETYKHTLKDNDEMRVRTPPNLYWGPSGRLPDPYRFMNVLKQKYKMNVIDRSKNPEYSSSLLSGPEPIVSNSLPKSSVSLGNDQVDLATEYLSYKSESSISGKSDEHVSKSSSASKPSNVHLLDDHHESSSNHVSKSYSSASEAPIICESLALSFKSNDSVKNSSVYEVASAVLSEHSHSDKKNISIVKSSENVNKIENFIPIRSLSRVNGDHIDVKTDLRAKIDNFTNLDILENILTEKNSTGSSSMVESEGESLVKNLCFKFVSKGSDGTQKLSQSETRQSVNQQLSESTNSIVSPHNSTSPRNNSISGSLRQSESEIRHSNQAKNQEMSESLTSTDVSRQSSIPTRNIYHDNVPEWSNMEPEMYHRQLQLGVSCLESLHILNDVQSLELATLSQQKLGEQRSLNRQLQISLREDDDERQRFFQDIRQKHQEALSKAVGEVKHAIMESTLAIMPLTRQLYFPPTYSIGQQTTTSVAQQTSASNSKCQESIERTISNIFNEELNSKSTNGSAPYNSDFEEEERTVSERSVSLQVQICKPPEPSALPEIEAIKSKASVASEIETVKSKASVASEIETDKSEASIASEIETDKSEASVASEIETDKSEASVASEIETDKSEASVASEIETDKSEASVASEIETDKSEASVTSEIETDKSEASVTSEIETDKSEASVTSENETNKSEASVASEIETDKSEASIASEIEIDKSEASIASEIEIDKSEASIASEIEIDKSEASIASVIETDKSEASIASEIETDKSVQEVSKMVNIVSSTIENLPISNHGHDVKTDDSISDIAEVSGIEMPSIHSSSISSVVDDLTRLLNKPSDLSKNIEEVVDNQSDTITESIQSIKNSQMESERMGTSGNSSLSERSSSETLNNLSPSLMTKAISRMVINESMKQTKVKMLSPLIPLKGTKKNKDYSTSEDESTQSRHTVVITDQSDLEGRVIALREQLKKRKSEAARLAREWKRRYRDTLKEKESSLQKQIKAYEDFIEETRRDLEKELDTSNQSNTSIKFTKPKIISTKSNEGLKRLDSNAPPTSKKVVDSDTSSISSHSEAINEDIPSRIVSDALNDASELVYSSDKSESVSDSIKSLVSNQELTNNYENSNKNYSISNENIASERRSDNIVSGNGTVPKLSETPTITDTHFSPEGNTSSNDNSTIASNKNMSKEYIHDSEAKTPSYSEIDEEKRPTSVQDEGASVSSEHDSSEQIPSLDSSVPDISSVLEIDEEKLTSSVQDASINSGEQVLTETKNSSHDLSVPEVGSVLDEQDEEKSVSSGTLVESAAEENVQVPRSYSSVSKTHSSSRVDEAISSSKKSEGDLVNEGQSPRDILQNDVKILAEHGVYADQSLRTEDDVSSISEVPEIFESKDQSEKSNEIQLPEEGSKDLSEKSDEVNLHEEGAKVQSEKSDEIQKPEGPKDVPPAHSQDETEVKSEVSNRVQVEKKPEALNGNALNALIREQVNVCLKIAASKKEKLKVANIATSLTSSELTVDKVTESILSNLVQDTVDCLKVLQNQNATIASPCSLDISQRVSDILLCLKKDNSKSPPSKHRPQDLMILSPIDDDQDLFDNKNANTEDATIDPVTEIQTDVEWFEEDFGLKSPKAEAGGSTSGGNFTYYFREIPDKPPPPYTPPQGAMLEKLAKIRKTLPSAWKIPNSEEEVDKLLVSSAQQLYNGFINDVPLEELAPDEKYFEMEARFDEITAKSERAYRLLVFDLCKAAIQQLQKSTEESKNQEPWKKIRLAVRNPVIPDTKEEFVHMVQKIAKMALETKIKSGLATKFKHKKHDFVDALLLQDMAEEETQWVNYENDELTVKLFVANSVFAQLVEEVVAIISRNKS